MSDFRAIREEIEGLMDLLEDHQDADELDEDELDEDDGLEERAMYRMQRVGGRVKTGMKAGVRVRHRVGGRMKRVRLKRRSATERGRARAQGRKRSVKRRRSLARKAAKQVESHDLMDRLQELLAGLEEATGYEFGIEDGELFYYDD